MSAELLLTLCFLDYAVAWLQVETGLMLFGLTGPGRRKKLLLPALSCGTSLFLSYLLFPLLGWHWGARWAFNAFLAYPLSVRLWLRYPYLSGLVASLASFLPVLLGGLLSLGLSLRLGLSPLGISPALFLALALAENAPLLGLWIFLLFRPTALFKLEEMTLYRREGELVLSLLLFQPAFFLFLLNFSLAEKAPLSRVLTVGIPSLLLWLVALVLPIASVFLLRRLNRLYRQALEFSRREKLIVLGEAASALAHEVRNPVQVFRGAIELLRSQVSGRRAAGELRGELDRAYELTFFLEKLANEFLTLSRTKREEEVELPSLLRKVVEEARPVTEPLGVAVELNLGAGLPRLRGDGIRLQLALRNLVENAAQSEPKDARVVVEAQPVEKGVVIRVKDRGKGIPPEHREHVFRPFFTTKEQGTGLGLAIVRQVVEEHGGRVELESSPGEGTVFSVFLPLRKESVP